MLQVTNDSKTTICQVLHTLNVGGAEVLAYRLALQLSDRYRFVFACLDEVGTLGEELKSKGFEVESLDRKEGLDFGCARRLAQYCGDNHVDLIHAHQYTPFVYSVLSFRRPAVIFTEHGRFFPDYPSRKRKVFNRLMLRKRDRVLGVGKSVRRALIENEGIAPNRIGVIYNGVDLDRFSLADVDKRQVRESLGLATDGFVIVQVARLDYLKDHITAVRMMERVVQEVPDAQLWIVGEGPERAPIEREIEEQGLQSSVLMLGQRSDISQLLAAADLFVLTSISEGIPVTFIEAMGAGLPIVATEVGGVPEVVLHDETGILTPSADVQALADAVIRLATTPELAQQMGQSGQRRAQQVFTEERMHSSYEKLYEEMLGVAT
jgi:glycosyltransferase involved in cell wall biosynthesis